MAKRSPILGYNHNVQYRGVQFHVQTEDSGIVNPHIFTHLFHSGVIVNTRKLVYDPDSADDIVKGLMQSQHKAILKELRRGVFDDKIDVYLADVPGLLPRGAGVDVGEAAPAETAPAAAAPVSAPEPVAAEDTMRVPLAAAELPATSSAPAVLLSGSASSGGFAIPSPSANSSGGIPVPGASKPGSGPSGRASGAIPPPMPPPRQSGVSAIPPIPVRPAPGAVRATTPTGQRPPPGQAMSAPLVVSRATEAAAVPPDDPAAAVAAMSGTGSGLTDLASLDPLGASDEAVEVYSPPLPSAAEPPGVQGDRHGEYSQHRKRESAAMPPRAGTEQPSRQTGAYRAVTAPVTGSGPVVAAPPGPPSGPMAIPTVSASPDSGPQAVPAHVPPSPSGSVPAMPTPAAFGARARGKTVQPVSRPRTPTVPRVSPTTAGRRPRSPTGGVVMSRPAVIVGGPRPGVAPAPSGVQAGPPNTTIGAPGGAPSPQRVRKAREDAGRGVFGQDLISEKSLDEVILAYLSEDGSEAEE